jgi:uncharacterized protein GlcG (DUF336 family)
MVHHVRSADVAALPGKAALALRRQQGYKSRQEDAQRGREPVKLETAQKIVTGALAAARSRNFKPLAVAVLDARGAIRAVAAEDGASLKRAEVATGKAHGALAMGLGSRTLAKMATERPHFVAAVTHAVGGLLVPVPGGVLVKDAGGALLGAVGISGDTSDNDEIAAMAGIEAAALKGDPGA